MLGQEIVCAGLSLIVDQVLEKLLNPFQIFLTHKFSAESTMAGWYQTLYNTMSGHWTYKAASAALLMILSTATRMAKQLGSLLCFPVSPPAASPEEFVANEASPPALFLFSTADPGVDNIAISREESGGVVVAVKYEDTDHLDHFIEHRESYINALVNFLHDCMGQ